MAGIDLSALMGAKSAAPAAKAEPAKPTGKPMRVKLADIEPDPNQPRSEKSDADIADIGENIKARGVKLPISVRKHPEKPGKWIINDGEMRYLGSLWAKVDDIPVIVDEDFDDFDQVNLNEKRYGLTPMQLGKFVLAKIKEGLKKGEIAKRLGKANSQITELAALAQAPDYIVKAYETGVCTSPAVLYEAQNLAEKFPEEVKEWIESQESVTRPLLRDFAKILNGEISVDRKNAGAGAGEGGAGAGAGEGGAGAGAGEGGAGAGAGEGGAGAGAGEGGAGAGAGEGGAGAGAGEGGAGAGAGEGGAGAGAGESGAKKTEVPYHNPANEKNQTPKKEDPNKLSKPLLLVEYEGRPAMVLLTRRPSTAGLIWIRYEDNGEDAEVAGVDCLINMLTDESTAS